MESFFELLKYVIPATIVFATAYFMLKSYLDDNYRVYALNQKMEAQKIVLPMRLQAYERLTLLCDRMALENLLLRVRMPEMRVAELKMSLMISVMQEFDHNTSQQLYVSKTLWQIMSLAKSETLALITAASEGLDPHSDGQLLVDRMFDRMTQMGEVTVLQKALNAIRTEAGQLF